MILLPWHFKKQQSSACVASSAAITITTTKSGTFTMNVRGTPGDIIYFDPGDGGAIDTVILAATNVVWNHTYIGATRTIRITGKIFSITQLVCSSQSVIGFSVPPPGISTGTFDISYHPLLISNKWQKNVAAYSANLKGNGHTELALADSCNWYALNLQGCTALTTLNTLANTTRLNSLTATGCTALRNVADLSEISGLKTALFNNAQLPCSVVDAIFNYMNTAGVSGCTITTNGACAPPTAVSDAARTALAGRSCTINETADCDVIAVVGDSLSAVPAPAGVSWSEKMVGTTEWDTAFVKNTASGGLYVTTMATRWTDDTYLFAEAPAGKTPYVFVMGGTNDIIQEASSSAQIISALDVIIDGAQTAGATVVAFEILPSTAITGPRATIRTAVNTHLGTQGNIDHLITVPPLLTDPSDPTYYYGGVHLTDAGAVILSTAVKAALGW